MRMLMLLTLAVAASTLTTAAPTPRAIGPDTRPPVRTTPGPAARFDRWRILGPGGGGTMVSPTISPHDSRLVVEHCDMTGAYITTDAGTSWRMFNLRAGISCFAFDPADPAVVYAGNAALWRSDDTGKTWRMVFPDPTKNTVEHSWSDHAEYFLTTDDASYPGSGRNVEIQAIAVDPSDSSSLYVVFGGGYLTPQPALLYRSRDRGRSWERIAELGDGRAFAVWVAPHERGAPGQAYVAREGGISFDAGSRWEHRAAPVNARIVSASIGSKAAAGTPVVYASTEDGSVAGGVFVSSDGGERWRSVGDAIVRAAGGRGKGAAPRFGPVACSASDASTAYVGFRGLRIGAGSGGLYNGIAKTKDGGATWTVVFKESTRPAANLAGGWIEARASDGGEDVFFDAPYSLGVAPADPDVCYATDLFRTYRTANGGRTWEDVTSTRASGSGWTTRGLDVTTSYGVHFDPFDRRRVFVSTTDIGLFRSEDGGASWLGSTVGVPNTWRNTTYWLAFDPAVRGLVWGAFSGTHDLPRPKMWRTRDPDTFRGGVGVSVDGGRTWRVSSAGMPQTAVTHVLLDPTSPAGRRTLYACCFGRGVFKSTDNGRTWAPKNNGIEGRQPFAWRITRAPSGTLYLVVARRSERGAIGDANDGALYRSTDGGEQWTKVPLPAGTNGPMGLAVDPRDERRLLLSAWGVARRDGDTGGGVFVSSDAGAKWRNILDRSQHVYDVTIDPSDPRILYAGTFDSAVYRSTDDGEHWGRVGGYTFKWGHRVIVDPVDPAMIYVTTFGGGVWHGPAAGDSDAVEDVVRDHG